MDPMYEDTQHDDNVLLSGILGLEEGTELILFPPTGPAKRVPIAPGDVLLFRGDCWHAGAGYPKKNRRVHFYLSSPLRRRNPGYFYSIS